MKTLSLVPFVALMATTEAATPKPIPVRTVEKVDLTRYLGEWFEIARLPNRFQRTCRGDVRVQYVQRRDARLDVINRCRTAEGTKEAKGVARVVDAKTSAKLKVRFAPAILSFISAVWGDYWILGLGDDYAWAVVGSPNRKYLWILSRTPTLEPMQWTAAIAVARANAFDVDQLAMTLQSSDKGAVQPFSLTCVSLAK